MQGTLRTRLHDDLFGLAVHLARRVELSGDAGAQGGQAERVDVGGSPREVLFVERLDGKRLQQARGDPEIVAVAVGEVVAAAQAAPERAFAVGGEMDRCGSGVLLRQLRLDNREVEVFDHVADAALPVRVALQAELAVGRLDGVAGNAQARGEVADFGDEGAGGNAARCDLMTDLLVDLPVCGNNRITVDTDVDGCDLVHVPSSPLTQGAVGIGSFWHKGPWTSDQNGTRGRGYRVIFSQALLA